jgi:hypothetical protein
MRYIFIGILTILSLTAKSQIKEYNPSIGWNYVKSDNLTLVDGIWYNSDFAAEKGYDYIFIMNHKLDSAMASIQVFNLQDEQIKTNNQDFSSKIIDLPFDVEESGVYRVFFGLNSQGTKVQNHEVQFMLVRRKKV